MTRWLPWLIIGWLTALLTVSLVFSIRVELANARWADEQAKKLQEVQSIREEMGWETECLIREARR